MEILYGFQPLTNFTKSSIIDAWQNPKYVSASTQVNKNYNKIELTVISDTKFAYSGVFKNKIRGSGKVKKALNFFEVTIKTIDILFIQTKLTLINNCFVKLTQIRVSLHGYLCYFPVQNPIFYISYFIIQLKTCQINSYYLMKIRRLNLLSAKPTK